MMNRKKWISQGTKSLLIGCHNPVIHTVCVTRAWKKLYGRWPAFWQFVCIVIHDVGHWGLDYLDDYEEKKRHWELGAKWAKGLFGQKGFDFTAGHCKHSGVPLSRLYKADKYSWHLAPVWWLWLNNAAEPELRIGFASNLAAVRDFKAGVARSVTLGTFQETHKFFLKRKSDAEKTAGMNLTELKKRVDSVFEYAKECYSREGIENPDNVVVTLQINKPDGKAVWSSNEVEINYDNNGEVSGCVITATFGDEE